MRARFPSITVASMLAGAVLTACSSPSTSTPAGPPAADLPPASAAEFVGSTACAACHEPEAALWRDSDHAQAMEEATDRTVLGDFNDRSVTVHGVATRFFRRDGAFFVRTDGPDGTPAEYKVTHTFGVRPLQQYLVELPRGRYQMLPLAWDTRPAKEGRGWFHLYAPAQIAHGDALHWTGPQQNWNFMCAECHSTNLKPGYDAATDQFRTTWSEIDVACEACHGPGSSHVAWARAGGGGDPRLAVVIPPAAAAAWTLDASRPTARRTGSAPSGAEVDTCARCHSRRGWEWTDFVPGKPLADTHRVALLEENLYFDDGQIREEVYEHGSFLQSRMHREGVTCSDCHDPHSGRLRAEGNSLCGRCHLSTAFDATEHHHHEPGSAGAQCVSCHMPTRTYMQIDERRDHSLRVPRPDLSVALGTPNACAACHAAKGARWAAGAVARWYSNGRSGKPHFAQAFHAARDDSKLGDPGTAAGLTRVIQDSEQPAIVRATALSLLSRLPAPPPVPVIAAAAGDADPLVRRTAAESMEAIDPAHRGTVGASLLTDPVRTVRLAAAAALAGTPAGVLGDAAARALPIAVEEYRRSLSMSAERAEAHFNAGNLERDLGRHEASEAEYRRAVALDPTFLPAAANLADLLRLQDRDAEAETILTEALRREPDDPDLHYALGLARIRLRRPAEALAALRKAADLRPSDASFALTYGVALHDLGHGPEAIRELERAAATHPHDPRFAGALAGYYSEQGDTGASSRWAERYRALGGN